MKFDSTASPLSEPVGRYRRIVLAAWCAFYFLCLDQYLFETGVLPVHHAVLAVPFAATVIALVQNWRTIDQPVALYVWCLVFVAWTLLGVGAAPLNEGSMWEVGARVAFVVFLGVAYFMFYHMSVVARDFALIASCACFLVVPTLVVDLLVPQFFSSLNVGRPAGFYINPNRAAFALVLGYVIAATTLRGRLRILQAAVTWVGVLLTASRTGLLLMSLLSLAFAFDIRQPGRVLVARLLGIGGIGLALVVLAAWLVSSGVLESSGILSSQMESRAESLVAFEFFDYSTEERESTALAALRVLIENPLLGAGPGFTRAWDEVPTHNMYLYLGAESGIIGLLLFPALLVVVTSSNRLRGFLPQHMLLVIAYLVWAFFSNSIFGEKCFVIVLAWMAAQYPVESPSISQRSPSAQPR